MSTERMTPPGYYAEPQPNPEAPIDCDGGFLNHSGTDESELSEVEQNVDYDVPVPPNADEEVERAYSLGLPAREFWLIDDPAKHKIETPTNEYGFVDDEKLIKYVMGTISPEYSWHGRTDRHHLYWTAQHYKNVQEQTHIRSADFRELHDNIIRIPRVLHNWIHALTVPPGIPDPEAMASKLTAWAIVGSFYKSVRATAETNRVFERESLRRGGFTVDQSEMCRDILAKDLAGVVMHLQSLEGIPREFWPIDPGLQSRAAAGKVGYTLMKGCKSRTKFVRYTNLPKVA